MAISCHGRLIRSCAFGSSHMLQSPGVHKALEALSTNRKGICSGRHFADSMIKSWLKLAS